MPGGLECRGAEGWAGALCCAGGGVWEAVLCCGVEHALPMCELRLRPALVSASLLLLGPGTPCTDPPCVDKLLQTLAMIYRLQY